MGRIHWRWLIVAMCLCVVTLSHAAPQDQGSASGSGNGRLEGVVLNNDQTVGGVVIIVLPLNLTETKPT